MARGNGPQVRVIYEGKEDKFVVFAESEEAVKEWRGDRSIPLVQVVDGFDIFLTRGHQQVGDKPSKATLENEFGTTNDDEIITKILEHGIIHHAKNSERQGDRNLTMGPMLPH